MSIHRAWAALRDCTSTVDDDETLMSSSKLLHRLGYADPSSQRPTWRLSETEGQMGLSTLAEEVPISVEYNGRAYTVLMGTPADLEDLAVGFSVTEGIVRDPAGVRDIAVARTNLGIELRMEIAADAAAQLESRRASAPSGADAIGEALRVPRRLDHTLDFSRAAIWRANDELGRRQSLNEETSSVHAAAWANMAGDLQVVREDISRHNALDKVLGALMREGRSVHEGFVIVTSRASCEMVQKVAACSVELMAAISRPTGLAMRIAQSAGVTLVGLVRERTANVYSVPARIT